MNLVIAIGNAVRDPVMRQGRKSGNMFCVFRLAINGEYKGPDIERKVAFVDFLAYGKKGNAIHRNLKKGQRMAVVGELITYISMDHVGNKLERTAVQVKDFEITNGIKAKDPIRDLTDSYGEPLIPKAVSDHLIKQIDYKTDEDLPGELLDEGALNDLFYPRDRTDT